MPIRKFRHVGEMEDTLVRARRSHPVRGDRARLGLRAADVPAALSAGRVQAPLVRRRGRAARTLGGGQLRSVSGAPPKHRTTALEAFRCFHFSSLRTLSMPLGKVVEQPLRMNFNRDAVAPSILDTFWLAHPVALSASTPPCTCRRPHLLSGDRDIKELEGFGALSAKHERSLSTMRARRAPPVVRISGPTLPPREPRSGRRVAAPPREAPPSTRRPALGRHPRELAPRH